MKRKARVLLFVQSKMSRQHRKRAKVYIEKNINAQVQAECG